MIEIWKDIKEYKGLYKISNFGRVKSFCLSTPRIKCLKKNNSGYMLVNLRKNNKQKMPSVHRLVALHFLSNPEKYKQVNHKNGNKLDNTVQNLEWCSSSQNIFHAFEAGLRTRQKYYCVELERIFTGGEQVARFLSKSSSAVSSSINRGCKCGGYTWHKI